MKKIGKKSLMPNFAGFKISGSARNDLLQVTKSGVQAVSLKKESCSRAGRAEYTLPLMVLFWWTVTNSVTFTDG